jgi:ribose 5-phosphate isomerase B
MRCIAIGSDHRGFELKGEVVQYLDARGYEFRDFGCYDTSPVDYPDIALKVAQEVVGGNFDLGILICGSGVGMSIAANKVKGIRAALCHNPRVAKLARQHNDANVLCLGILDIEGTEGILDAFLLTPFEGGRHKLRVEKIRVMEEEQEF